MFRTSAYFKSNINKLYLDTLTANRFLLQLSHSPSPFNDLPFHNDLAFIPLSTI